MTTTTLQSGSPAAVRTGNSTRDAPLTRDHHVIRLGLLGGVLLSLCLVVIALFERSKGAEFLAFVFLVGVAPPLAALLLFVQGNRPSAPQFWLGVRFFLGFTCIGILGLGGVQYAKQDLLPSSWPFIGVVIGSAAAALICTLPKVRDLSGNRSYVAVLDALLIGLLTVLVVVFSPLSVKTGTLVLIDYIADTPHAFWWVGFGLIFVGSVIWLCRIESRATIPRKKSTDSLALFAFGLLILSLFHDDLYFNLPHYAAYVGPAMHAYHGGQAMVDVFSIYGLMPWLAIEAGFSAVAPTFGMAALLVRLSMLAYLFLFGFILYAVTRWRLSALSLMVPFLMVAITFFLGLYDLTALPSTTGFRYLVPSLMVVILITTKSPSVLRWFGTALVVLASFWSIEALVYTLAPWSYFLFLQAVRARSIKRPGSDLLIAFAAVLIAHLAFALGTYVAVGKWINYGPYLGLVGRFRPDHEGFLWIRADPNFAAWIPVWLAHFLVLATAFYHALRGREPTGSANRLVPVSAFGLAIMIYFAGSFAWYSLGIAFLPIAVLAIHSLQELATKPRRYGAIGMAVFVALMGANASLVAFGAERFSRPALFDQGNRTVLRRCFTADGCQIGQIPERLQRGTNASPLDPAGPLYQTLHDQHSVNAPVEANLEGYQRIEELAAILKGFAPDEARVAVLANSYSMPYVSMSALMETGQWFKWPISSPENDEISPGARELILRSVVESPIEDGELLVATDRDRLISMEKGIFDLLTARCRLQPVETREFHSVFRMRACIPANDEILDLLELWLTKGDRIL